MADKETEERFELTGKFTAAALTKQNIAEISDGIAKQLAAEAAKLGDDIDTAFHVRLGGGHSRSFSRTSDHRNVIHSRVVVSGSGDV